MSGYKNAPANKRVVYWSEASQHQWFMPSINTGRSSGPYPPLFIGVNHEPYAEERVS